MGGTKPGRNELCPCGSDKKFKRCHGGLNVNYEEMISRGAEEAKRRAEINRIQQQRQQGLGRPIIADQTAGKTVHCYGINSCKGTSDCKLGNHACKGQNDCKGQGFKAVSMKECSAQGGSTTAPAQ